MLDHENVHWCLSPQVVSDLEEATKSDGVWPDKRSGHGWKEKEQKQEEEKEERATSKYCCVNFYLIITLFDRFYSVVWFVQPVHWYTWVAILADRSDLPSLYWK